MCVHETLKYTVYHKKYAHGFCFAVLCCGYTLTDFPISIRLTSLALGQSNDCPSASKATLMNMDKYLMWIHYERLHNHNKAKHNRTVCKFLGTYCTLETENCNGLSMNDNWTLLFTVLPIDCDIPVKSSPIFHPVIFIDKSTHRALVLGDPSIDTRGCR